MRGILNIGRATVVTLLAGIAFGFVFAYLVFTTTEYYNRWNLPTEDVDSYLRMIPLSREAGPLVTINTEHRGGHHHGEAEDRAAKLLSDKVRVLCWVMTQPQNHEKKAKHVRNTWGKRCNYLLFMSSEADYRLPAIRLKVGEGRDALWEKTKESFKYVYQHYLDRVDWVMKADDDTYVIVENLRFVLSQYNASEKVYFGCQFKPYVKQGYMSGGAGYVLSKEAVRAFVEQGIPNSKCRQDGKGAEDVEIGKCLEAVGVRAVDSRDAYGRHRFFPLPPVYHLVPDSLPKTNWFWKYIYYPMKEGFECCSDTSISFHYISPNEMYVLEFLVYHVRPYGINHNALAETSSDMYYLRFTQPAPPPSSAAPSQPAAASVAATETKR